MKNSPIDATRSMNTHIFANFWNFAGGDSASRPPTRGRVGGRVEAAALSEPAKFQKFAKMWVFIDRVASEGQYSPFASPKEMCLVFKLNYSTFLELNENITLEKPSKMTMATKYSLL